MRNKGVNAQDYTHVNTFCICVTCTHMLALTHAPTGIPTTNTLTYNTRHGTFTLDPAFCASAKAHNPSHVHKPQSQHCSCLPHSPPVLTLIHQRPICMWWCSCCLCCCFIVRCLLYVVINRLLVGPCVNQVLLPNFLHIHPADCQQCMAWACNYTPASRHGGRHMQPWHGTCICLD